MTLQEQLARELCRWDRWWANESDEWPTWKDSNDERKNIYRREARKLVKMVCGSCGLAKPLASMEVRK